MGALKEHMDSMVGQYATPDGAEGGPFKIVSARHADNVILVTLDTPEGPREFKAHECAIRKEAK